MKKKVKDMTKKERLKIMKKWTEERTPPFKLSNMEDVLKTRKRQPILTIQYLKDIAKRIKKLEKAVK